MKIFFTASQRGQEQFDQYYQQIGETIKALGHTLIGDDIFTTKPQEFYVQKNWDEKKTNAFFEEKIEHIQDADVCIFDCSTHSLSIGFVMQKAIDFNKPTIGLYFKGNELMFLTGAAQHYDSFFLREYDEHNVQEVVRDALEDAKDQRTKRFNFFINPMLLNYLEKASKASGLTKSLYIRNLILKDKARNEKRISGDLA